MRTVLLFALLFSGEQHAVSRYGSSCLHISPTTWAEAPMVDGEPDYKAVTVHGLVLDKSCGVIEIRRK